MKRYGWYGLLLVLFVLHNDWWYWDDPRLVLGMPVGLTYHVVFCAVTALAFWGVIRFAWPFDENSAEDRV